MGLQGFRKPLSFIFFSGFVIMKKVVFLYFNAKFEYKGVEGRLMMS